MDFFISIIHKKSIKPIHNIFIDNNYHLHIEFESHKVVKKINTELRHFFTIMQQVNIEKTCKNIKYCIKIPLKFHDVFGITTGDIIKYSMDNQELFIYFV